MRDLNRESFMELLEEKMEELSEIFIEHEVPNFKHYSAEDDKIEDEDVERLVELFKDIHDIIERNT